MSRRYGNGGSRQEIELMAAQRADVPPVSGTGVKIVDAKELAAFWRVPESWVRSHSRERTPKENRIPSISFGRYRRYELGSARLEAWFQKQRR
jgi:hypothetical protein